MRLLSAVVAFASASIWDTASVEESIDPTEWDFLADALGDDPDHPENSSSINLHDPFYTIPDDLVLDPNGVLTSIPLECLRPLRMLSSSTFTAVLQGYKKSGRVLSSQDSLDSQGVYFRDPRYKSLHGALWRFVHGLALSEEALRILLELNQRGQPLSPKVFKIIYKSRIAPADPQRTPRCGMLLWYAHVINPMVGRPFRDAEVEKRESPDGIIAYRARGTALKALIDIELSRVAEGAVLMKRTREN